MLSLPKKTQSCAKMIQVLKRSLLCLIQPGVPPGTTIHKFRLFPQLRLCCLYFFRRPCRPFFRRGSSRLGPVVAAEPLLLSDILRSLLLCLIQRRVLLGTTVPKFQLCPRLRL